MKRLCFSLVLLLAAASCAQADQITFSFIGVSTSTVAADIFGMSLDSSPNTTVTDATTGASFVLAGHDTASTGAASDFIISTSPNLVSATYNGAGANSVLIEDLMGNTLLSGSMNDNGKLLSSYPNGTGAFLSKFTVNSVSPAVLGLFGLNAFSSQGSISATFGSADLIGGSDLDAIVGGGTVTIQATETPEPSTLTLAGCGLMFCAFVSRRKEGRP